jgi:hypothetical protein
VGIAELIGKTKNAVMLDPWAARISEELGIAPAWKSDRIGVDIAMNLIARIPNTRAATVGEILDIRTELRSPLVRFRSAMAKAAKDAPSEPKERLDFIRTLCLEELDPAVIEIEERRNENSLLEHLVELVKDPRELLPPAGGLALAFAGSGRALLGAAGGVLGVATPIVKATLARRRVEREISKDRFYFLHRLQEIAAGYQASAREMT